MSAQGNLFTRMLGVEGLGPNGRFMATSGTRPQTGRGLGDDGSVMMISGVDGLGSAVLAPWMQDANTVKPASTSPVLTPPNTALNTPVKLFNVELPLWAWLAIAALLGGAGGYYLGRR